MRSTQAPVPGMRSVPVTEIDEEYPPQQGVRPDGSRGQSEPGAEESPRNHALQMADLTLEEITYKDGSTYKGQVSSRGLRQGKGVWTSETITYEGEWANDEQHGVGKQIWVDGRIYTGQFGKGMFSGQGKMEWHTQHGLMVYEGQYKDDKKHGEGKFMWPDGRQYDGQWVDGQRSGKALYTDAQGRGRWGYWRADQLERCISEDGVDAEENSSNPRSNSAARAN